MARPLYLVHVLCIPCGKTFPLTPYMAEKCMCFNKLAADDKCIFSLVLVLLTFK
jgi:hypothetical protein